MSTVDTIAEGSELLRTAIERCRRANRTEILVDSTGARLTGGATLTRALVLRRLLSRHHLDVDERNVGIILPPTVAGTVVNLALALDRRVSVNLNFMLNSQALNECIRVAGIRHVITSRKVLERLDLQLDAEVIVLEDVAPRATLQDKLICAFQGMTMPTDKLFKHLHLDRCNPDDLLTILFTSGSTGVPKGVMLSHRNIGSNARSAAEGINVRQGDVLIGVLPFFHAFGLTVTCWMALLTEAKAAYHTSPLEPDAIAKLTREEGGTILLSTPTFLQIYVARCRAEDFATLNMVVAGAEHLAPDIADRFEQKFGTRPFAGFGVTEASPIISFNVPADRAEGRAGTLLKEGSVGKAVNGVNLRIVDRETGALLETGHEGLLHVSGPNIMLGYLGQPELTASVIQDGWYNTGDIARIDAEGFLTITGRQSQFSKIGGEMVPHLLIQDTITNIVGDTGNEVALAAVTAVPDLRKGERIVVIHSKLPMDVSDIVAKLRESDLPALFIPSPDSFYMVDRVPVLPTGKIDLRQVNELAIAAVSDRAQNSSA